MARNITVYHNPRCSKSRATVEWLTQQGLEFDVVEYLKNTLSHSELQSLITKLGVPVEEVIRKGEKCYRELGLHQPGVDEASLMKAILDNPVLLERPIVTRGNDAAIGRPLNNVIELFDEDL